MADVTLPSVRNFIFMLGTVLYGSRDGWEQALADDLDVPLKTVSEWVRGVASPPFSTVELLRWQVANRVKEATHLLAQADHLLRRLACPICRSHLTLHQPQIDRRLLLCQNGHAFRERAAANDGDDAHFEHVAKPPR